MTNLPVPSFVPFLLLEVTVFPPGVAVFEEWRNRRPKGAWVAQAWCSLTRENSYLFKPFSAELLLFSVKTQA